LRAHYFLRLSHNLLVTSEMITKAIAIHENAVWSVEMPMAMKASPRMRKMEGELLRVML